MKKYVRPGAARLVRGPDYIDPVDEVFRERYNRIMANCFECKHLREEQMLVLFPVKANDWLHRCMKSDRVVEYEAQCDWTKCPIGVW